MAHKKRPFAAGDIVSFSFNGHKAIARLIEKSNGKFGIDAETAVVEIDTESELPSTLPSGVLPWEIFSVLRFADAPERSRFFKNLIKCYDVLVVNNIHINADRALLEDDVRQLKALNSELQDRLAHNYPRRRSIFSRIFG